MELEGFSIFAPQSSTQKKNSASEKSQIRAVLCDTDNGSVNNTFVDLGLDAWIVKTLQTISINIPTPVQRFCIPEILKKKDVIAAAMTGSGKTAAFALPILHHLSREPRGLFSLILTPTRELAIQIAEQFQVLGKDVSLSVCVAVGGLDMITQSMQLSKKPHVVIATPGRFADLIESGNIEFSRLSFVVFDEADRLVAPDSSFMKIEMPLILSSINKSRDASWLFFSATISSYVSEFQSKYRICAPFEFNGNKEFGTVDTLKQFYMLVPSQVRDSHLVILLRQILAGKTLMIFVGKCKTCALLLSMLKNLKISAVGLHSQMSQKSRLASLSRFKSGVTKILVSTDVGSRGLDIPSVEVVINFDLPADSRDYVHRVGRAARAGRDGISISFVHELDVELLRNIEGKICKKMDLYPDAPKESDIIESLNEVSSAKRLAGMALHDYKFGEKAASNKRKWAHQDD